MFDPTIGRWISEDPSGIQPDEDLFRYCHNNPTNLIDPSGLAEQKPSDVNPHLTIAFKRFPNKNGTFTIKDAGTGVMGELKIGEAELTRKDPKKPDAEPEVHKGGTSIWFEGVNAHKVDVVQFFSDVACTLTATDGKDLEKGFKRTKRQISYPVGGVGEVTTSLQELLPMRKWYLDTGDKYTTQGNAYIRRATPNTVAIYDKLHDEAVFRKLQQEFPAAKNPDIVEFEVTSTFLTYIVADGTALGYVVWRYTARLNLKQSREQDSIESLAIGIPDNKNLLNQLIGVYNEKQKGQTIMTK